MIYIAVDIRGIGAQMLKLEYYQDKKKYEDIATTV